MPMTHWTDTLWHAPLVALKRLAMHIVPAEAIFVAYRLRPLKLTELRYAVTVENLTTPRPLPARKPASPFRYFSSPSTVIRLVVTMFVRFPLSLLSGNQQRCGLQDDITRQRQAEGGPGNDRGVA